METRANYVLIGAFTLLGIFGAFAFVLWLAKLDVDRQYAYYNVLFDDVSGLSAAGDVRYNGLAVGQVVGLELDDDDATKVRVRLEVAADTPVREDTVATLEALGVTGVSYVALTGGTATAPPLPEDGVIQAERSALQSLFEGAPELLETAIGLIEDVNAVFDEENRAAITDVLGNLASASGRLDQVLTDFEGLSDDLGLAAREVAGFTGRLETLSSTAETTLTAATETLTTANSAIQQAEGAIDAAVTALNSAETAFETADGLMQGDLTAFIQQGTAAAGTLQSTVEALEPSAVATIEAARTLAETRIPQLLDELQGAATTLETQVAAVGTDASGLMQRYTEVGTNVLARVEEAEAAIAALETAATEATGTLTSIRQTSDAANTFIETQGRPLAQEATDTLVAARGLAEERLPALIDQANATLATVDTEAQALSSDTRVLITRASARLAEAQGTLERLDQALLTADETMVSLGQASDSVTALAEGEGAALVADARVAAAEAREAIATINATVQADLPDLMADVRIAAETANRVIDTVGRDVSSITTRFDAVALSGETALIAATETFSNANETLAAVSNAMDTAEGTLNSAEGVFDSVQGVIDDDLDAIAADIRVAATAFTTAVEGAAVDIDAVADEVLAAAQSASSLVGTVEGVVVTNRRQLSEFLRVGLPQFQRFTDESRRLVVNLERLVNKVERDPARFLLGTQSSEFRR